MNVIDILLTGVVGVILIIICKIDMEKSIIPDKLNGMIFLLGALATWLDGAEFFENHVIGMLVVSSLMVLINLFIRGAFGGGDIKLMISAGLFFGSKFILQSAFWGILISGIYGMILLLMKAKTLEEHFPLGPFLVCGMFITGITEI